MRNREQERREAALSAMHRMPDSVSAPREYQEVDFGADMQFIGTAPDGRQFGIGYRKAVAEEPANDPA